MKLRFPIAILICLFLCISVYAQNNVSEIDISVSVRNDGSARVVQKWTGTFYEGTENYIPVKTGDIGISDLKVYDEYSEYTFVSEWDINADFEDKKRKCGIVNTSDGVELCFGISEYGENVYHVEYTVTDFIKGYTDYDGTNFMFVNPDMSTFPTDANIEIYLDNKTQLNTENCAIWAFGYYGEIVFDNGKINAFTNSALDGNESMIVMLRLDKEIIHPLTQLDYSFDIVKDNAFEGSDYDDEAGIFEIIFVIVIFALIFAVVIIALIYAVKRSIDIKKFYKNCGYFREVPNKSDIEMSHFIARSFGVSNDDSLIIASLMLCMINDGCITPLTEENVGLFGKIKKSTSLKLVRPPQISAQAELYKLLSESCGDDGVLGEKELEKYAYAHPEKIENIIHGSKTRGEASFKSKGGFLKGSSKTIKNLTENGKAELSEVMGLKKYLEEFSLISEREADEITIWKEYMIYAALFGIADKVIDQLEKLYPDKIPEVQSYNRNVIIACSYYRTMYRSSQSALQKQRSSGMGGRASFGGGGGFSGGGRGGGSR